MEVRVATTIDDVDLEDALAALRGEFSCLSTRLRTLTHSVKCSLSSVEIRVHYPAFRGGEASAYDLARAISHFLPNFALHRTERRRVERLYGKVPQAEYDLEYSLLKQAARDTFKKAHETTQRNGEAGELLL